MSSTPILTRRSPTVHKVSLSQGAILPEFDYITDAMNEPLFFLFFEVNRRGVIKFTADDVETEYPFSDFHSITVEIPRHILYHPQTCAYYLWHAIPWTCSFLNYLDVSVARRLVNEMGSYAFQTMMNGNFSGFQMVSTLTVILTETVIFTKPTCDGASESVLEKLTAESFYVGDGSEHENCVICLDEFSGETALTRMPCSHVFHQSCLFEWLRNSVSCPLCRSKVEDDLS